MKVLRVLSLGAVLGISLLILACAQKPQPVAAYSATLPELVTPAPVMDSQVKLSRDGILETLGPKGWSALSGDGLPVRTFGPGQPLEPRPLNSFQEARDNLWTITTPFAGLYSTDKGAHWTTLLVRKKLGTYAYLTALAASPAIPDFWLVGTSFSGLFESHDEGKTWKRLPDLFSTYDYGDGYHEMVNAVAFSYQSPDTFYASVGKEGDRLFIHNLKTGKTEILAFPGGSYLHPAQALAVHQEGDQEILEARTDTAWWRYATKTHTWLKLKDRTPPPLPSPAKLQRLKLSQDRWGFYLNAHHAANPRVLEKYLAEMKKNGLNAVVIDMKNDLGELTYDSHIPLARACGAVQPYLNLPELVKTVHAQGFYLIGRVVVFKDKKLFFYDHNKYAVWDKTTNEPWVNHEVIKEADGKEKVVPKEFWVDTYAQDVWNYNAAIAKELQDAGVDEVQFDYIRFPSDGAIWKIRDRFAIPHMTRLDALEAFLKTARAAVSIPLSVDIYGFNGYFEADYLGQNMAMMSKYVDVISPMFYPSHFFKPFLWNINYFERARIIYQDGSDRAWMGTKGRVNIRPWVQTFLLGGERKFSTAHYVEYFEKQLEGLQHSHAKGFLLWNNMNDYYMVTKSVAPYETRAAQR
ncbi:MAG: hypothetical protein HKM05_00220 [Spirochaetales bacterium]|nr:hypothetical protein [Spirochaetales bacterium]